MGCISEPIHARELVAHLLNQSLYEKQMVKTLETAKLGASVVLSLKEGLSNLNTIIGHVLAIGPGMLISAWTAKLIFAHSAIPAYFCYFFPWIYSPMAWALYNIYYQVLPDLRLFVGLAVISFWPVIMAGVSLMYGLHKKMRIARLMHVVNNLLVMYYFVLMIGYGFLLAFALGFNPTGNDWISEKFRGDWRETAKAYAGGKSKDLNFVLMWLVDSFATFFFTCCAITDAFIVMISQEHNEAWLMHRQSDAAALKASKTLDDSAELPGLTGPMLEYEAKVMHQDSTNFACEEDVIKDWLLLIHDVRAIKVGSFHKGVQLPATIEEEEEAAVPEFVATD